MAADSTGAFTTDIDVPQNDTSPGSPTFISAVGQTSKASAETPFEAASSPNVTPTNVTSRNVASTNVTSTNVTSTNVTSTTG